MSLPPVFGQWKREVVARRDHAAATLSGVSVAGVRHARSTTPRASAAPCLACGTEAVCADGWCASDRSRRKRPRSRSTWRRAATCWSSTSPRDPGSPPSSSNRKSRTRSMRSLRDGIDADGGRARGRADSDVVRIVDAAGGRARGPPLDVRDLLRQARVDQRRSRPISGA